MNPIIKIIFLPIMIVVGLFTVAVISCINIPFALVHRIRERKYRESDLNATRAHREQRLKEINIIRDH